MEFVPFAALLALIKKFTDFTKLLSAGDLNGIVTQVEAWVVGVAVILLFAQSNWADGIAVADRPLSSLNVASQIIVGLTLASAAGVVHDTTKALDASDTAVFPALLSRRTRKYEDGAV